MKFPKAQIILGIILLLFACYYTATTKFYNKFSGFNYAGLLPISIFIFLGVLNIKQIDQTAFLKTHKRITGVLLLTTTMLFIYAIVMELNTKPQPTLEEMYRIE